MSIGEDERRKVIMLSATQSSGVTVSPPRRRCRFSASERVWLRGCILCGGDAFKSLYPSHFPWLKRCARCGLRLAQPQPSDDELARIYDADYYKTFGFAPEWAHRYRAMKQASFRQLLSVAERYFASRSSARLGAEPGRQGRLLDVGSALGDLVAVAGSRGWDAQGVEPNPYAAALAEEVAPGATFSGRLDELDPPQGSFDLITCVDVIEHLRRPDETLRQMYRALRPGGGLVIVTNDVASAAARGMGPRWVHYHLDHLWYFSRETLRAVVAAAGLDVRAVQQARKIFNLSYVLGILAHSPNHRLLQRVARFALRWIPDSLLCALLPPMQEGVVLLAQRPFG